MQAFSFTSVIDRQWLTNLWASLSAVPWEERRIEGTGVQVDGYSRFLQGILQDDQIMDIYYWTSMIGKVSFRIEFEIWLEWSGSGMT